MAVMASVALILLGTRTTYIVLSAYASFDQIDLTLELAYGQPVINV